MGDFVEFGIIQPRQQTTAVEQLSSHPKITVIELAIMVPKLEIMILELVVMVLDLAVDGPSSWRLWSSSWRLCVLELEIADFQVTDPVLQPLVLISQYLMLALKIGNPRRKRRICVEQ